MERKDELKDILLDREDDIRKTKLKKILVVIGALSILFLVVIATMKILNTDDTNTNLTSNGIDSRLVLPPMPENDTRQSSSQIQATSDKKGSDQLFEQVPILPENKTQDDFEDMVKKLKEKESPKSEQAQSNTPVIESQSAPEIPAMINKQEEKPKQIVETKKQEPKIIKEAKKDEPKEVKKSEPAKPVTTQQASSSSIEAGSYVQVSATTKTNPDQKELGKISAKGYTYKTLRVGNSTKVLIGPFSGAKLQSELANIRKEINKDAFIYRVK